MGQNMPDDSVLSFSNFSNFVAEFPRISFYFENVIKLVENIFLLLSFFVIIYGHSGLILELEISDGLGVL